MKIPKLLVIIIVIVGSFFALLASLLCAGYFYLNLVFLPKKVIPQITNLLKSQYKKNLSLDSIYVNPWVALTINAAAIYELENNNVFIRCKKIYATVDYKSVYNSWRKNKNFVDIPVKIHLQSITINQPPITATGDAVSDFLIKINFKNPAAPQWDGEVKLKNFTISNIPFLTDIQKINATIKISPDKVFSQNIEGKIHDAFPAKLSFTLNNFAAPRLELNAELTPLLLNINCALTGKDLKIENINAVYNKTNLVITGEISDMQTAPKADLVSIINVDFEQLSKLPIPEQTCSLLNKFDPKGELTAKININGPLQEISKLQAIMELNSAQISFLNYTFKNFNAKFDLKDGQINMANLAVCVLESTILAKAKINLLIPQLPYEAAITAENIILSQIKNMVDFKQDINATINTQLLIQGSVKNLDLIKINSKTSLHDFTFEKFSSVSPIELTGDIAIQNLKDIALTQLRISDNIISLAIDGNIANIYLPNLNLSGSLTCKFEDLTAYKNLNFPPNLTLSGITDIRFKINGLVNDINKIHVPFEINSPEIKINQFPVQEFNLKAEFESMRLNITSMFTKYYNGEFSANGYLNLQDTTQPDFKLNVYLKNINLENFTDRIPPLPLSLKGLISSDINISGYGISPQTLTAQISSVTELTNAKVKELPLEQINLALNFDFANQNIDLKKLNLKYKNIEISSAGKIISPFKNPQIDLLLNNTMDINDLSELLAVFTQNLNLKELNLSGQINTQIKASGPVSNWTMLQIGSQSLSEQISIKNILFTDVAVIGNLENNLFSLKAQTNAYDGSLSSSIKGNVSEKDFPCEASAQIKNINIKKLITQSKIINQPHEGIFSLNADLQGKLSNPDSITGTATANLMQAKLAGIAILKAIGTGLNIDFLSEFDINEASGTFKINNSCVHTDNTQLIGTKASLTAQGKAGFDQRIELTAKLLLSPDQARQINPEILENAFVYENNQYYRDIDITGTLASPQINYHKLIEKEAKRQIQKTIEKEVLKSFEKFLLKK